MGMLSRKQRRPRSQDAGLPPGQKIKSLHPRQIRTALRNRCAATRELDEEPDHRFTRASRLLEISLGLLYARCNDPPAQTVLARAEDAENVIRRSRISWLSGGRYHQWLS